MGNACSNIDTSGTGQNNNQQDETNSNSARSILATLAPVALYAVIWFILFLVLRNKFPRYYRPRTFVGSLRENERTPRPKDGLLVRDHLGRIRKDVLTHDRTGSAISGGCQIPYVKRFYYQLKRFATNVQIVRPQPPHAGRLPLPPLPEDMRSYLRRRMPHLLASALPD